MHHNLIQRVLSAVVILVVVVPVTIIGGTPFRVLVLAVAAVAWWECATMGRAGRLQPFFLVGGIATVCLCLLAAAPAWRDLALLAAFGAIALTALQRQDYNGILADIAYTLTCMLWIGWLAGYAVSLRDLSSPVNGLAWLLAAIAVTIAADSGAYFAGRLFGRHLLCPRVSPKKTVEGLIGGLAAAAAIGVASVLLSLGLPAWQGALIGVAGGLAAVLGDLFESLVKRQLGVKDSSRLIPGHGGVLDRIDGLLFVIPVMAACVMLIQSG